MPKRVLLLVTDLELGGTPTVVRELAMRLGQPGESTVDVACLGSLGPIGRQIQAAGISVAALDARPRQLRVAIGQLVGLIRQRQIDVVLSFLMHANVVAAFASIQCGRTRYLQSIQTTQPTPRWHWWLQSVAQLKAEKVIVPSPSVAKVAGQWAHVPKAKIVVIPNAVDLDQFVGVERSAGQKRVGFLGRLDPIKRIGDLVEAMTQLDNQTTLQIWGQGPQRDAIAAQIQRLNLAQRVSLRGPIDRPQDALEAMDVLVLPSAAEGFGLVLIEAMAMGVPVIGTDVPGIGDVIQDGRNGLLVPPQNPAALAQAIGRILSDSNLAGALIESGKQTVRERYCWPSVLEQYRRVMDDP